MGRINDGSSYAPRNTWTGTIGVNKEIQNGNVNTKILVGGTAEVKKTATSLGAAVQAAVTKIEVTGKSANGKLEATFGAEALSAGANAKLDWGFLGSAGKAKEGNLGSSGYKTDKSSSSSVKGIGIAAGAEAYLARTVVGLAAEIIPGVKVGVKGEVGVGAAAGAHAYLGGVDGKKGVQTLDIGGKIGLGATVGAGLKIEVDPFKLIPFVGKVLSAIPGPNAVKPAPAPVQPAPQTYSPPSGNRRQAFDVAW